MDQTIRSGLEQTLSEGKEHAQRWMDTNIAAIRAGLTSLSRYPPAGIEPSTVEYVRFTLSPYSPDKEGRIDALIESPHLYLWNEEQVIAFALRTERRSFVPSSMPAHGTKPPFERYLDDSFPRFLRVLRGLNAQLKKDGEAYEINSLQVAARIEEMMVIGEPSTIYLREIMAANSEARMPHLEHARMMYDAALELVSKKGPGNRSDILGAAYVAHDRARLEARAGDGQQAHNFMLKAVAFMEQDYYSLETAAIMAAAVLEYGKASELEERHGDLSTAALWALKNGDYERASILFTNFSRAKVSPTKLEKAHLAEMAGNHELATTLYWYAGLHAPTNVTYFGKDTLAGFHRSEFYRSELL